MPQPPITKTLVTALAHPVETTVSTIVEEFGWGGRDLLDILEDLKTRLLAWNIDCIPPLGLGDFSSLRVLRSQDADPLSLANDEIAAGEGPQIEFKESLRLDTRKFSYGGRPISECGSDDVVLASLKTIAAFLNSGGGTLLVGVADDGTIKGIPREYPLTCPKNSQNFDHWELCLRSLIEKYLVNGRSISTSVTIQKVSRDGTEFARVLVGSRQHLSFIKFSDEERLYVRSGNRTLLIRMSEIEQYFEMTKLYS